MNTNLIHKWLRDPVFASEGQAAELPEPEGAVFLPIEVAGVTAAPGPHISRSSPTGPVTVQRVDIALSDGRRILVEGPTALSAVLTLVEGLAQ
ncbi:transposase [Sulfitobacter pseudonitzschiae]|nr:transposase [Pseudosulfitobacter pseudonitzschiae]MBM1818225.1 transposase [Pseudosulfitobacter pseudonitzschiae]MBM1835280.1 transposase [Pseudosulfitobacter pseudonitzschiae]MBM1840133.1 transposase [Pseudosulfitobacter pseudonitzschiae]MBM1844997.1 transposase [Pseudosulfitobacter pseudonitzschiae]MBM1849836.1 transposase [Pseudosulfitobacter pseudonitzschiae]